MKIPSLGFITAEGLVRGNSNLFTEDIDPDPDNFETWKLIVVARKPGVVRLRRKHAEAVVWERLNGGCKIQPSLAYHFIFHTSPGEKINFRYSANTFVIRTIILA